MQEELQALGCVAREIVVDHKEEGRRRSAMSGAAAVAAAPYWRNAGMTYISYANTCLKEPHKIKALNREQVYYKLQIYQEGEPHKAGACSSFLSSPPPLLLLVC
jgi:F-type H+-transporting ATPase subunit epsilon